jgi:hypothetical protein
LKKKVIGIVAAALSVCMLFNTLTVPAVALESGGFGYAVAKRVSDGFGGFADSLLRGLAGLLPSLDWPDKDSYVSENFYPGTAGTVQGDNWLCGFASESIIPDDIDSGKYNSAGYSGNLPTNYLTGVMDDQRVAAVCLGTGGKTAVFISLDGFGLTGTNVRKIRARLAEFARANGIVSINITVSHSHYCIDTHGLGTNMLDLLKFNLVNILTRQPRAYSCTNEQFMNGLFAAAEKVTRDAFEDMRPGTLRFGRTDITDIISDSRTPDAFDENVNRIRFVPDTKSTNEIWLVNMGVHPTSLDMGTKLASADYPGAIVKYAKELAGADAAFYQGAICGIYSDVSGLGIPDDQLGMSGEIDAYGKAVTQRLIGINTETAISPKLNIRHSEVYLPIENGFLQLACKLQLLNNTVLNTTGKLKDIVGLTEIGYCELGDDLAIALTPGEFSPELAWGGTFPAGEAWNNTAWDYEPMMNKTGGRTLLCFGLTNDQIGYIVPDNDYANTFAQLFSFAYPPGNDHYHEMISLGKHTASSVVEAFFELMAS